MNIISPVHNVQHYYWRNAECESIEYTGIKVAPHGRTLRDSFEIAAGKMVKLDMLDADLTRTGVSVDEVEASIEIVIIDTDLNETQLHKATLINKSLNATSEHEHDSTLFCNDGSTLAIYTTDNSNGGTISYTTDLVFQIFDM